MTSEKSTGPMTSWLGRSHLAWGVVTAFDGQRSRLWESEPHSFADIHLLQFYLSFPDSTRKTCCCLLTYLDVIRLNEPGKVSTSF